VCGDSLDMMASTLRGEEETVKKDASMVRRGCVRRQRGMWADASGDVGR
jgi:hypothetical protein